ATAPFLPSLPARGRSPDTSVARASRADTLRGSLPVTCPLPPAMRLLPRVRWRWNQVQEPGQRYPAAVHRSGVPFEPPRGTHFERSGRATLETNPLPRELAARPTLSETLLAPNLPPGERFHLSQPARRVQGASTDQPGRQKRPGRRRSPDAHSLV